MKVLILSCNTGEGHNSCAAALEEECRNQNIPCDTEDALRFISPEVSRFISNWHVRIYRHAPGLFRVGYRAAEDHPAQFHEGSALYRYLTQGAEKLCGFIAGSGYDTVICTHTFAALMVSEVVKTHLPNLKTCFIATDYTCSPSVKDSSLDRYFIPFQQVSNIKYIMQIDAVFDLVHSSPTLNSMPLSTARLMSSLVVLKNGSTYSPPSTLIVTVSPSTM